MMARPRPEQGPSDPERGDLPMVHVEYTATGNLRHSDYTEDRFDGRDRKKTAVEITQEVEIRVKIEFPGGHVNLEGFTTDLCPDFVFEDLQHTYTPDSVEVEARSVEARIYGNEREWVTAARRYIAERPNMDAVDALSKFQSWGDTEGVEKAIRAVERGEYDDLSPLPGEATAEQSNTTIS